MDEILLDGAALQGAATSERLRRIQVIVNPIAGRRRRGRVSETLALLRARGLEVAERDTAGPGDARALARAAAADPPGESGDLLVVAGGDGTVNEAVNGLVEAAAAGARRLPLAILPLGTANVLAHEIGLAVRPDAIARTIAGGHATPITLGRLSEAGGLSEAGEGGQAGTTRCFILMAGVGFDAHVVEGIDLDLKRRLGKGAYVWESLRQIAIFGFPRYRVILDGVVRDAASAIVANARCYGGPYVVAPEAGLARPGFQVLLFEKGGPLAVARGAVALTGNRLSALPEVRVVAASRLRIEGPAGDPIQGDGDTLGRLPVDIDALPGALDLVYPPAGPPGG